MLLQYSATVSLVKQMLTAQGMFETLVKGD